MNHFRKRAVGILTTAVFVAASAGLVDNAYAATPAVPAGKSSAPTDLKHYPKLTASSLAALNATASASGALQAAARGALQAGAEPDVVAVHTNVDGSGTAMSYTPAPGVSAATLYTNLKAAGVQGIQSVESGLAASPIRSNSLAASAAAATSASASTGSLATCAYGNARLFRCDVDTNPVHQIHWTNGCCSSPRVIFVDHTSSKWPVDTATYTWNRAQGIDASYSWARCPGIKGTHCVRVVSANYGATGWVGRTPMSWGPHYNFHSATIQLNEYPGYKMNAYGYRQAACHELGHALGMGHNTSALFGSCMYKTIFNGSDAQTPNGNDFSLLARLYSVRH